MGTYKVTSFVVTNPHKFEQLMNDNGVQVTLQEAEETTDAPTEVPNS